MNTIHSALIEAIIYLIIVEGLDDREDSDLQTLESVFTELNHASPTELEELRTAVRVKLKGTQNPAKIDALKATIDPLST